MKLGVTISQLETATPSSSASSPSLTLSGPIPPAIPTTHSNAAVAVPPTNELLQLVSKHHFELYFDFESDNYDLIRLLEAPGRTI